MAGKAFILTVRCSKVANIVMPQVHIMNKARTGLEWCCRLPLKMHANLGEKNPHSQFKCTNDMGGVDLNWI